MTPQIRGVVPEPEGQRILDALALRAESQEQLEVAVADALKAGASVRELAAFAGLSVTTIQKYGRAHGWPTVEQKNAWDARRAERDEWQIRLDAANTMLGVIPEDEPQNGTPSPTQE
jgi:hypothetical protein